MSQSQDKSYVHPKIKSAAQAKRKAKAQSNSNSIVNKGTFVHPSIIYKASPKRQADQQSTFVSQQVQRYGDPSYYIPNSQLEPLIHSNKQPFVSPIIQIKGGRTMTARDRKKQ
ncbi:MAG: hypothetical protein EZS28_033731 [Streblomastix strix]|uniref:Uncharacterized protein n=1 Tax=Streblomastix strix TaxID=222440 RepID=A0A5J4UL47_9EUKA|nr:MAG: hypothetical protein EZS28_033731 [Streblomastix strix]